MKNSTQKNIQASLKFVYSDNNTLSVIFNDNNLSEKGLDQLARIGDIPKGGLQFNMPDWSNRTLILTGGLQLAVLGAIDSLLTSLVADNITQTRHDSNRELIGQGIGNAVGGFFNGLPGAGATMRTVINVKSGGNTPISGMTHSIVLLIVLVAAGPLASQIPKALLAGILINKYSITSNNFSRDTS